MNEPSAYAHARFLLPSRSGLRNNNVSKNRVIMLVKIMGASKTAAQCISLTDKQDTNAKARRDVSPRCSKFIRLYFYLGKVGEIDSAFYR